VSRRKKQTALTSPVYRGRRLALLLLLLAGMAVLLLRGIPTGMVAESGR